MFENTKNTKKYPQKNTKNTKNTKIVGQTIQWPSKKGKMTSNEPIKHYTEKIEQHGNQ
jgi:hypothetical protein